MIRETKNAIVGTCFLAATVAAYFIFGSTAAIKAGGVACVLAGAIWVVEISFPPKPGNETPAFYFPGWVAVFMGLVVAALGLLFFCYAPELACLAGGHTGQTCF
jgi:hypothetical protein